MKKPIANKHWEALEQQPLFDAVVYALGFEARAIHIARTLSPKARHAFAVAFSEGHVLNFESNREWFASTNHKIEEVADDQFESWCQRLNENLEENNSEIINIGIDISCFNRFRLGALIDSLRRLESSKLLRTYFWYSLARFTPPPEYFVPNRHVGPVHPHFAGWFLEPELPPVAVVGLGYEEDKALGAVEHIEATATWAFVPESPIGGYKTEVEEANRILLESIPANRQIAYSVGQPMASLATLQSLTQGLLRDSNVIMLPFGPKIFTLCCLLLACSEPRLAVWRVSSLGSETPVDRVASEFIYGLIVDWK